MFLGEGGNLIHQKEFNECKSSYTSHWNLVASVGYSPLSSQKPILALTATVLKYRENVPVHLPNLKMSS